MKIINLSFLVLACLIVTACSSSGPSYSANSVGQVSQVEKGKIISMEKVNLKGSHNSGQQIGGFAGGLGGSLAGGGSTLGRIAGSIGGAVAGGIIGGATEKALTSSTGYQFIINKDNGGTISVLQTDDNNLKVGDRVTILLSGNNTRIVPDNISNQ